MSGKEIALVAPQISMIAESVPLSREAFDAESKRLDDAVAEFSRRSKSGATMRAYKHCWTIFVRWCAARGIQPMPATADTICRFVTALATGEVETESPGGVRREPKRPATIRKMLSAIAFVHRKANVDSQTNDRAVKTVLDGIVRSIGSAQDRVRPITRELLATICARLLSQNPASPKTARDVCALTLGWAGALRSNELVNVRYEHIEQKPQGLVLSLPYRKTDQQGKGTLLSLPKESNPNICPVVALSRWTDVRRNSRSGETRVLLSFRGREAGSGLKPVAITEIVRECLDGIVEDVDSYGSHSLRAGFVTSWVVAGGNLSDLMSHTGHTNIATLSKYARSAGQWSKRPWTP